MRNKLPLFYLLLAAAACTANDADSTKTGDTGSASAATAASDDAAGRDAIAQIRSAWKDAADRKDSTAVAAFYADDAVLAVSNAPASNGRAEIEKTLGRMVSLTRITSIDSKDLVVMGDDAYDYGTFTQEGPGPDGKMTTSNGHFLVTLHKQGDGSWKITRHVGTIPAVMP